MKKNIKSLVIIFLIFWVFLSCNFEIDMWGGGGVKDLPILPPCQIDEYDEIMVDARDGQVYGIVQIDSIYWMAENLNYEMDDSWWYDHESINGGIYGRLYTWEAALQACPDGWHLPTDEEWLEMVRYFHPNFVNHSGVLYNELYTCESDGFNAMLGGWRYEFSGNEFVEKEHYGYYWTRSEIDSVFAWSYQFVRGPRSGGLYRSKHKKARAISCRCVRDRE